MPNPYDDLIGPSTPAPAEGNPYDQLIPDVDPLEQGLRRSLLGAMQNNPDAFAKARRTGEAYGVPADVVATDQAGWDAKTKVDGIDFGALASTSPALAKWLTDYRNASIAHDELGPLAELERRVKGAQEPPRAGWWGAMRGGFKSGLYDLKKSAHYSAFALGMIDPAAAADAISAAAREQDAIRALEPASVRAYREQSQASSQAINENVRAAAARDADRMLNDPMYGLDIIPGQAPPSEARNELVKGLLIKSWEAITNPGGAAVVNTESLASSLPSLGGSVVGGTAGLAGGPAAPVTVPVGIAAGAFAGEVPVEFGMWVEQRLREKGISTSDRDALEAALSNPAITGEVFAEARRKALATAGVDALFAAVGGKIATAPVRGIAGRTAATAADVGTQAVGGMLSEAAGQGAATGNINWGDVIDEGVGSVFQSGAQTAVGAPLQIAARPARAAAAGAAELVRDTVQAVQGVQAADAMAGAVDALKKSKTLARSPEAAGTLMQGMGDATVHYDVAEWDRLWAAKGMVPADVAEQMAGNADAYAMAKASGGEISVPMTRLVTALAQMDEAQAIIEAGRVHGMSAADARKFAREAPKRMAEIEKQQAKLEDEVNKILQMEDAAQADDAGRATAETVRRALFKQMEMALLQGGQTKTEARTNAAWFAALEGTRMERAGYSPEMSMAMVPQIITEGRTTEMDVALDQIRRGAIPTDRQVYGATLIQMLRSKGLQDQGGELTAMDAQRAVPGLVNNQTGSTLDAALEGLREAGVMPQDATVPDLLDAIREGLAGVHRYDPNMTDANLEQRRNELLALEAQVREMGLDIGKATNEEIKRAMDAAGYQQPAFHGTGNSMPYDRFRYDSVGGPGGEGTQAYGWGLYFASQKEIAAYYKKWGVDLMGKKAFAFKGKPWKDLVHGGYTYGEDAEEIVASQIINRIADDSWDAERAIRVQRNRMEEMHPDRASDIEKIFAGIQPSDFQRASGRLYKVEIPESRELLDWDKPMNEQNAVATAAFKAAREQFGDDIRGARGSAFYDSLSQALARKVKDETGSMPMDTEAAKAASDWLRQQGVPGLQYFDSASRVAGEGSHNYVIFDDTRISIQGYEQPQGSGTSGGFNPQANTIIFTRSKDASTFFHEVAHWYLESQQQVVDFVRRQDPATLTADQQQILKDWTATLDFLGIDEGKWLTMDLEERRPYHEKFAAIHEGYVREGKAPSRALRAVMARASEWLKSIYRSFQAIVARAFSTVPEGQRLPQFELNDEIRAIMDRMLATDKEIAEATAIVGDALPGETLELAALRAEARAEAEAELRAEVMKELSKEARAEKQQARLAIEPEVRKQVMAEPVYRALQHLQPKAGTDISGVESFKLSAEALDYDYKGSEVMDRLRRLRVYTRDGGVSPSDAVFLFRNLGIDFKTPSELVMALANAEPMEQRIRRLTDEKIREAFPSILADAGAVSERAQQVVHNDRRAELLMREYELLAGKVQGQAGGLAGYRDMQRVIKQQAQAHIDAMPVRKINPNTYLRAERKAMQEAVEAAAAGKNEEALRAKRRQMLNSELYRAAMSNVQKAEQIKKLVKGVMSEGTYSKVAKAGSDYEDRLNAILEGLEFREISGAEAERRARLAKWLQTDAAQQSLDKTTLDMLAARATTVNYMDLTGPQMQDAMDGIKHIVQQAQRKDTLTKNAKYRSIESAAVALETSTAELPSRPALKPEAERSGLERAFRGLGKYWAAHRMVTSLVKRLDNFKDGEVAAQLFATPLNEAAAMEREMNRLDTEAYGEAVAKWSTDGRSLTDRVMIPALGVALNKETRLTIALNYGNLDNRDRLFSTPINGRMLDAPTVQQILETLDATDKELVESIWRLIDRKWPQIEALTRRTSGVIPQRVEAEAYTTKAGTWTGGYYPIAYDPEASVFAEKDAMGQAAEWEKYNHGSAVHKTTAHGFRKARGKGKGIPLRLSLNVMSRHLSQVNHDLTHYEMVQDFFKLFANQPVRETLARVLSTAEVANLKRLVDDVAANYQGNDDGARLLSWTRRGISAFYLAFNPLQPLLNVNNILVGAKEVGVSRYMSTLLGLMHDKRGQMGRMGFVRDSSLMMKNRERAFVRDVAQMTDNLRGPNVTEKAMWVGYYLTGKSDFLTATATWLAAYDKARDTGVTHAEAVQQADLSTVRAHGTGETYGLTFIQRHPALHVFTPFISYAVMYHNQLADSAAQAASLARQGKVGKASAKAVLDGMLLLALPAVVTVAVKSLVTAGGDDGEEEDYWIKQVMKEILALSLGGNIVGRELSSGVATAVGATDAASYRGPTGTMAFGAMNRIGNEIAQGDASGAAKAAATAAGIVAGVPGGAQVIKTVEGIATMEEHGDFRAIFSGPPRK